MEIEDNLNRAVIGLLINKGFPGVCRQNLNEVLQLLQIHQWNPIDFNAQVIQHLFQLVDHHREIKFNYFEDPHHNSIPIYIKLFISNIIREIISLQVRLNTTQFQEATLRNINKSFPFFPYPNFRTLPMLPQFNTNNPITQQLLNQEPQRFPKAISHPFNMFISRYKQRSDQIQVPLASSNGIQPSFQIKNNAILQNHSSDAKAQELEGRNSQLHPYNTRKKARKQATLNSQGPICKNPGKTWNKSKRIKKKKAKRMVSLQLQTDMTLIRYGIKLTQKPDPIFRVKQQKKQIDLSSSLHEAKIIFQNEQNIEVPAQKSHENGILKVYQGEADYLIHQPEPLRYPQGQGQALKESNPDEELKNELSDLIFEVQQAHDRSHEHNPYQHFDLVSQSIEIQRFSHEAERSHRDSPPNNMQNIHQGYIMQELYQKCFSKCPCKGSKHFQDNFKCNSCQNLFHRACLLVDEGSNTTAQCPVCKLRTVDLFENVKSIIEECYFTDINETVFEATLNLQPYLYLRSQSQLDKAGQDKVQDIQIRCLRLQPTYERAEVTWPDEVIIKLNGQKVTETYGLHVSSVNKKRRDMSYSITRAAFNIDFQEEVQDYSKTKITIESKELTAQQKSKKKINNDFTYLLGVYLVQKVPPEVVYHKIVETQLSCTEPDYIPRLFECKYQKDELEINMIFCSLRDPYTSKIMDHPVRGLNCLHPQCFDLRSYISFVYNTRNKVLRCPFCAKEARQFKLDKQQAQMIQRVKLVFVPPQQIIMMKEGDIIFKVSKEMKEWLSKEPEAIFNQNYDDDKSQTSNSMAQQKDYIYYKYDPLLDFRQVSFAPQLYLNKPKRPPKVKEYKDMDVKRQGLGKNKRKYVKKQRPNF